MDEIQYKPNDKGVFFLEENGSRIAEMIVDITDGELTVYHTGVEDEYEGQGIGKKLITAMSDYARKNELKVKPLCPFVKEQFQKNPEKYEGIYIVN